MGLSRTTGSFCDTHSSVCNSNNNATVGIDISDGLAQNYSSASAEPFGSSDCAHFDVACVRLNGEWYVKIRKRAGVGLALRLAG
jgi:hypothetical protein